MKKFITQKNSYSCGPVAIANALIWAGESVSMKKIERIKSDCKCKYPEGTFPNGLVSAILKQKALIIQRNKKFNVSIKYIDNYLKQGSAILLRYSFAEHEKNHIRIGAHFALIIGKEADRYVVLNDHNGVIKKMMKRETLEEYLKPAYNYGYKDINYCFVLKRNLK